MAGVFAFMAIYYRIFGLVVNAVLASNVIVLAGLLSMFGGVLSLPGIAGIILTVGMAVDVTRAPLEGLAGQAAATTVVDD